MKVKKAVSGGGPLIPHPSSPLHHCPHPSDDLPCITALDESTRRSGGLPGGAYQVLWLSTRVRVCANMHNPRIWYVPETARSTGRFIKGLPLTPSRA